MYKIKGGGLLLVKVFKKTEHDKIDAKVPKTRYDRIHE